MYVLTCVTVRAELAKFNLSQRGKENQTSFKKQTHVELNFDRPPQGDWNKHKVFSCAHTAHRSFFLHLCSWKEQGFLGAKRSSREMKEAVKRCRGQDWGVQSNSRHMECFIEDKGLICCKTRLNSKKVTGEENKGGERRDAAW